MLSPKPQPLGVVADYCRICRDIVPIRFTRVAGPPRGRGPIETVDVRSCTSCGCKMEADTADYRVLEIDEHMPLETLIEHTNPELPVNVRIFVANERLAIADAHPKATRWQCLQSATRLVAYVPEQCKEDARRNDSIPLIVLTCLAFVLAGVLFIPRTPVLPQLGIEIKSLILAGIVAVGYAIWYIQSSLRTRRLTRLTLLALLARALRPYSPDEAELRELHGWCRTELPDVARQIDVTSLHNAIQALPDIALVNVRRLQQTYSVLKPSEKELSHKPRPRAT